MATGKVGGSVYAQKPVTPPGNALLATEQAAQVRQDAGLNPSASPLHAAVAAAHAILHGTQTPTQAAKQAKLFNGQKPVAEPVFTPITAAINAVVHLPSLIGGAHQQAVALAHPSAANPPSLHREIDALLSGAIGLPRMGVNEGEPTTPGKITYTKAGAPRIPKGTATVETGGEGGRQVREGLQGAKQLRGQQEQLYSEERGKRITAADQAVKEAGGGVAGYQAALGQLKGELPKLEFNGMSGFNQDQLDQLFTHVQEHPTLRPYEKIRAQSALLGALGGRVPTRSELNLLGRTFGVEAANRITAAVPFWSKVKSVGLEVMNVPRSIMASMDLSAPFRQGLVAGAANPRIFLSNFAPMVKAFGSDKVYQSIIEDIHARPTFPAMQKSGLAFTELGSLQDREEQFMSNLAERIPVVGRGIRASGRAYTGFLDKMRADMFDYYLDAAKASGVDVGDENTVRSIARFVNSATGRGDLGALKSHAVTLNTLFFSPRLLASRLNFMNPVYYAKLDPFARKQALKAAFKLAGALGATLYLAKLGGAKVSNDPLSADFAKIKIGDTRLDLAGGFQQPLRLLAQLAAGKIVSSTTGKTLNLGPEGPGKLSRYDIGMRFLEQKLAPTPSLVIAMFKGTDFADKPFSWKQAAYQRMVPLLVQDTVDLQNQYGNPLLDVGAYGLGAFGIGLQTYSPTKPKASGGTVRGSNYGQSSGGGGSVYGQPSGGGGSAYGQP